jgi:IS30 family transposase
MAMSPHSNSSGFGFGQYSAMQSQSTTTTATMPPPVEITVELVLEVIDQLQELWETNEKFRQVVTDEAWKESMEFLYQELERLSSQSQEKE